MGNIGKVCFFLFFLFCYLTVLPAEEETMNPPDCQPFHCGKLGRIHFPLTNNRRPRHCGLLTVHGCDDDNVNKTIQFEKRGRLYQVENVKQGQRGKRWYSIISIIDEVFQKHQLNQECETFNNMTFSTLPFLSFQIISNLTLLKCNQTPAVPHFDHEYLVPCNFRIALNHTVAPKALTNLQPPCSVIQLPGRINQTHGDIFKLLTDKISLEVHVFHACFVCYVTGGECRTNRTGDFYCARGNDKWKLPLGLGFGFGCLVLIIIIVVLVLRHYNKRRRFSSNLLSTNSSSDPSSKADLEGSFYYGVHMFSYSELEEATNNFDAEKELGDGGFGTVYLGKLRDGREVAVKRLYEHNYKRFEQFRNEIEILTRLRHKNLVTLYGCTSRRSRELLLVYEYIPNGTVADHLHGDRAKPGFLTWPIRLSIAIETASALAYLHVSDVVHRDVKTNNILLDNNFCVKVADFGLSRLFPLDVTHVSTAPQGSPGYVDPEYHQCYQLTDKSDVYSFGVVLIELISSMPAVDITRHRSEINLANLAINKIQKCEFDELIDPCLGYMSDEGVKRMTILVAELAFRCLQQNKEMRPSMEEVLEELQSVRSAEYDDNKREVDNDNKVSMSMPTPTSPLNCDEASLLKNIQQPPSPITVTSKWPSSSFSTTPNVSC